MVQPPAVLCKLDPFFLTNLGERAMSLQVLGIDLGTSTTCVAVVSGTSARVIAGRDGEAVFPSAVAFPPKGGRLIGRSAKERSVIDPENTLFSVKRILGQPWTSEAVKTFRSRYPMCLVARDQEPVFRTRAGDFTAVQVSSMLAQRLAEMCADNGITPRAVVVGVPTSFSERQQQATVEALGSVGFDSVQCESEPHAAVRAYLKSSALGSKRHVAVYDLGGGTFDFAVCQLDGRRCVVISSGGAEFLGGDDIDLLCADWVAQRVLEEHRWDVRTSTAASGRLLAACEKAKIELSNKQEATIELGDIEDTPMLKGKGIRIERSMLTRLISDLVGRTFQICDEVIANAGMVPADIAEVFMVGGSTRIALVQQCVGQYFLHTGKPPHVDPFPEHVVALGAAYTASDRPVLHEQRRSRSTSERRQTPRNRITLAVEVRMASMVDLQRLFAEDISKGGVFIKLDDPPDVGSELVVQLQLDTGETVDMPAKVVHRKTAIETLFDDSTAGMGLEFLEAAQEGKQRVKDLVATAPDVPSVGIGQKLMLSGKLKKLGSGEGASRA